MSEAAELIRVRGQVQGVGFRPTVCRLASELGLPGWVKNDADGVLIAVRGSSAARADFVARLLAQLPPLASIEALSRTSTTLALPDTGFSIEESSVASLSAPTVSIVPDAAVCDACRAEVLDPSARRYRYALTTCTHCGPRFSIARSLPWDRARTTLETFPLCATCRSEYADLTDRRYHAEPIACPDCGPRVQLSRCDGTAAHSDALAAIAGLLARGEIVALKGIGGYQLLACANQPASVARLRQRKQRPHKPFALMARDLDVVKRYCAVSELERTTLESAAAPIVLLRAHADGPRLVGVDDSSELPLGATITYGFMLPNTPLHVLALQDVTTPVVCTSGNRSEEPQVSADAEVFERLGEIADWIVSHDRPIQHGVDDSVVRVFAGRARVLRRARGLAPAPLPLPDGFAEVAAHERVFAAGADLKAALCVSRATDLVLSQHLGDLDNPLAYTQYREQSRALCELFAVTATRCVSDNHSAGRAAEFARELADHGQVPYESVPHHHAHFAACLGENAVPLHTEPLLGIVLDGIGAGEHDALWGAEVLVGDYARVERLGTLAATALLGGDRAAREPWRCLYVQLRAALSWPELDAQYSQIPSIQRLKNKPISMLEDMLEHKLNAPLASSCGRLFDAVAAALGLCFEQQTYEGQAAQALEALVSTEALARACAERAAGQHYPLPIRTHSTDTDVVHVLDPQPLWRALLVDLASGCDHAWIAARFHVALAAGFAELCELIVRDRERSCRPVRKEVALSGGCLQNACLHGRLDAELRARGFTVLSHAIVPANDGGIALGQALVSLARARITKER